MLRSFTKGEVTTAEVSCFNIRIETSKFLVSVAMTFFRVTALHRSPSYTRLLETTYKFNSTLSAIKVNCLLL
jgi:hypothetical protein